ncbi:MAG: phosphate propanoyltransferase [Candidatus Phytoplasma stylosanthis]|uniref:phosphate propanoyltransferase n=1 Tax=Candidatus Phytoplasma stylosanthis TaxID=2798314 RepID=UPI002939FBEA|nr:phosphate propanoyltransferase [Candidatus Phytoplasma stylosanthis]MDV3168004.1 phosphate propanoyltransferase [Candidatus Phytoplasma stylosanthis]MDV3171074.1 phosphate propanoyltransferase [Candidatus Phytoplasma stylosanthis]MDV3174264.1 phosphate propanoyltransferase [Candidatus Phytoplasma stylosanthis]MDV3202622.1 phosphate propanoyltransferase [Candidatus Phytoplasma stylosanthis]
MMKLIPIGISGRHAHLSQKTLDILFGSKDYKLTFFKNLKQEGQFAAEEKINVMSSTGKILEKVRVLGPTRNFDQIEISQNDNLKYQFNSCIRSSGNIAGSSGAILIGPKGQVEISEGVIIADRHIHFSPEDAENFNVKDKQIVNIKIKGIKSGILGNVLCRVDKTFKLECHLDTDDACAFLLKNGDQAELITEILV